MAWPQCPGARARQLWSRNANATLPYWQSAGLSTPKHYTVLTCTPEPIARGKPSARDSHEHCSAHVSPRMMTALLALSLTSGHPIRTHRIHLGWPAPHRSMMTALSRNPAALYLSKSLGYATLQRLRLLRFQSEQTQDTPTPATRPRCTPCSSQPSPPADLQRSRCQLSSTTCSLEPSCSSASVAPSIQKHLHLFALD
jgi:hypothetical protein